MTYDYTGQDSFNVAEEVSSALGAAMSFIFERTPSLTSKVVPGKTVAGVTHASVNGEFSVGDTYGEFRFKYSDNPSVHVCTVDSIDIGTDDLGWSSLPFTTDATLYDALLNKHKLLTRLNESKPLRMGRVAEACGELKALGLDTQSQERVNEIVDRIIKEVE